MVEEKSTQSMRSLLYHAETTTKQIHASVTGVLSCEAVAGKLKHSILGAGIE